MFYNRWMIKHIIEYCSEIKSMEQTINTTTWINVKGLRLRVNQISKCHTLISVALSKWQNYKGGNTLLGVRGDRMLGEMLVILWLNGNIKETSVRWNSSMSWVTVVQNYANVISMSIYLLWYCTKITLNITIEENWKKSSLDIFVFSFLISC